MKVLSVSSFHISSTRDVWDKVNVGLKANGVEVMPYDMMQRFMLMAFLEEKIKRSKREMPRDWTPTTLAYEVITGAAIYNDADWVLVVSPQYMPNEIPQMLRRIGIKTAAYFTECPYEDGIHTPVTASNFEVALVSDLHSVGLFESFCPRVLYVPHCYDPAIHYPGSEEREDNTVFVGTGYGTRVKFMKDVEWPARLDLYGWWPKEWLRYDSWLRKALRGATQKRDETADIYRKSKTAFSLHRQMRYVGSEEAIIDGEAYSLGPRNWELAACGTFAVSDRRQELVDVFGDSVPLFDTPEDLSVLLRRAFDDPIWRREKAAEQMERAKPYSCDAVMKPVAQLLAA